MLKIYNLKEAISKVIATKEATSFKKRATIVSLSIYRKKLKAEYLMPVLEGFDIKYVICHEAMIDIDKGLSYVAQAIDMNYQIARTKSMPACINAHEALVNMSNALSVKAKEIELLIKGK